MKLIAQAEFAKLIEYLPRVKDEVEEWQLINIHVIDSAADQPPSESVTDIFLALFADHDGRLYPCSPHELIAIIRWPSQQGQLALSRRLERGLPANRCEILVHAPDADGLKKLELRLCALQSHDTGELSLTERRPNCALIADDDLYMRSIIRKGLDASFTVHEATDGNTVLADYKQYVPTIVFLDIHLPNREGPDILRDIIACDPAAYVIMLSSDSSTQNVLRTARMGAKGFLTKPFTKEKLLELIHRCPGIRQ